MSEIERTPRRADVLRLKDEMLKHEQADLPTEHYFADGMYLRLVPRPADCTIVGKVHKKEHFYVVVKGRVTIVGDGKRETVSAPAVFVCKPGTQRAVYAHEDSVCLTVHRTDKRDLEEIEVELVEPDEDSPYLPGNLLKTKLLP